MKDLIVSATAKELEPFLKRFSMEPSKAIDGLIEGSEFDVLISGIGQLATVFSLTSLLDKKEYRMIMNFGIAGSFKKEIPIRSVVSITEEVLSDFGAENGEEEYLSIFDMGLISKNAFPFKEGALSVSPCLDATGHLPQVRSLTVSRVLSHEKSIKWAKNTYNPDVVNMEGAAIFYICLKKNLPCIQIRAISDYVGKRDKASWDIAGAVQALDVELMHVYEQRYNLSKV